MTLSRPLSSLHQYPAKTTPELHPKSALHPIHHPRLATLPLAPDRFFPYLQTHNPFTPKNMNLGAFSISLNVKDIKASKQFYETLGFSVLGGDIDHNYLIMKNGDALVGLFQGMFQGNILTFNPGWDQSGQNTDPFQDVRHIQQHLKAQGIPLITEADPTTTGPASFILTDPDGNTIYIDQHR